MPSKLMMGAAGAAGLAGVSGVTYTVLKKDSPRSTLKELFDNSKGRILLDASGDKHDKVWEQLAKEYKDSRSGKVEISEDYVSKTTPTKDSLKRYCLEASSRTDTKELEVYSEWCSRNSLKTQFNSSANGKKWNESTQSSDWTAAKTAYDQESGNDLLIPKTGTSGNIEKNKSKAEDFMAWCPKQSNVPYVNNEDAEYKKAEKLCLK
ncbi:hypothetical protein HF1_07440 [Mycoplasma haemofelis str. Langford 1]|uniref:Uncharacterized protein n=1 Tax=Mycoplasma haemofelis (strain Langford 1) TaxID=941640 RepID=E8ZHY1_MYCHL|nr:hypothetical protein [Mycoplasma haemofelis]CBY92752.1 hypothetical protein HF1_07440 [Mycoplasma haemofelis str. Langford 1]